MSQIQYHPTLPERTDYGYAASNVVAMTVIINRLVLRISQTVQ